HAIECRINAESPQHGFRPCPGRITRWRPAEGAGIRVDSHCFTGYFVPPYYDSLLAKLIVHGGNRTDAVARTNQRLTGFQIERIGEAGFHAIELIASSHIKKCVRELREDPFERMRLVAQKIRKTPLRAIGAERISAFELSPDSVIDLWFERLVANGMRQLRISDPANDPAGWRKSVARAKRVGLGSILN